MDFRDILVVVGMLLIVYGMALIFVPAAYILGGSFLMFVSFISAYVRKAGDD